MCLSSVCTSAGMAWVFHQQNATSGVDASCVALEQPQSNCMFAEHTMKHVSTPLFALQSQYDSWQTQFDLGSANAALINQWGRNLTTRVRENLLSQHGMFLDSCHHHCGDWGYIFVSGDNQPAAFEKWYREEAQREWVQDAPYPCRCLIKDNSTTVC